VAFFGLCKDILFLQNDKAKTALFYSYTVFFINKESDTPLFFSTTIVEGI
jgi:hypothetical protein